MPGARSSATRPRTSRCYATAASARSSTTASPASSRCWRDALARLARADRRTRDFTRNALRRALAEVVACFPVYRTYIVDQPSAQDRRWFDWAVARARRCSRAADPSVLDFIHDVLRGRAAARCAARRLRDDYRAFARRLQQFTGAGRRQGHRGHGVLPPSAAARAQRGRRRPRQLRRDGQGVPRREPRPRACAGRTRCWRPRRTTPSAPRTCARASTVISEMPAAWRLAVRRWSRMNRSHRREVDGQPAPSRNDEYLLYQTLRGHAARRHARRAGARGVPRAHRGLRAQGGARGEGAHAAGSRATRTTRTALRRFRARRARAHDRQAVPRRSRRRRCHLRLVRRAQHAGDDDAEVRLARRAGSLPGPGGHRPVAGRSRQSPAGRFRAAARTARDAADDGRAAGLRGERGGAVRAARGRPRQDVDHLARAATAPAPAGAVRRRRLRPFAAEGRWRRTSSASPRRMARTCCWR